MKTILSKGDTISAVGARKFLTELCNVSDEHYNQQRQDYYPENTNIDVLTFKKKNDLNNHYDPVTGILTLHFGPEGYNEKHITQHTKNLKSGRSTANLFGVIFVSELKTYEFVGVFEPIETDVVNKKYRYRIVSNDIIEY